MPDGLKDWLSDGNGATVMPVLLLAAGLIVFLLLRRRVGRSAGWRQVDLFLVLIVLPPLLAILAAIEVGKAGRFGVIREWMKGHRVYESLLLTLVAGVGIFLVARLIEGALLRGAGDVGARHKARRAVAWARTAAFVILLILIWGRLTKDVGVFLGILGAGVALSLQETLLCIVGWALIVIRKPFDIGDRIEIGDRVGDVIDISVFHTALLEVGNWVQWDQSTGRMVYVPNSTVFRSVCFNYTKGFPFIWNELTTVVTFESDWKTAKQIVLRQAETEADKIETEMRGQIEKMQRRFAIHYEHLRPIVYTTIADHGVALTLRYLSPVRERRVTTHAICEGILEGFAHEAGIDFAYPTTRFYTAPPGKPPFGPAGGKD